MQKHDLSKLDVNQPADKGSLLPLPPIFQDWFASKKWRPRDHQLQLLNHVQQGHSCLLIAPTGAGKTMAGFLPSLIELENNSRQKQKKLKKTANKKSGIHTLYISPLKALAVDIMRNLQTPIDEMGLDINIETRTGDTPQHKRQRQKLSPPDILLTTPEQLALLIANKDAEIFFSDLKCVVLDELHSLVTSKRGHLLSLGLARLRKINPNLSFIGLSATVARPNDLRSWLVSQGPNGEVHHSKLVNVEGGAKPNITILKSKERIPWKGHSARYAMREVYEAIKEHKTTLLFVNTRSQAEILFKELWTNNEENLPIALHHGSLDVGQRRRVEQAMATNSLRAVVATSTLDLGIDWGDVDLVIHIGAPKGASRLAQRIGRSNHRMNEPSRAILVPGNRFEVLECQAALDANYIGHQDTPALTQGAIDVLAQHILGVACAGPFFSDDLYIEITSAAPYADLDRQTFERCVEFVSTGGYALKSYDQYAKIKQQQDGSWRLTNPRFAQQYRLNCGTILENPLLNVCLTKQKGKDSNWRGGPSLGKVEEGFAESLAQGDTFLFAGKTLRFEGIRENVCYASITKSKNPAVPAFAGGKFPLSTFLAQQVRAILADQKAWERLPNQVREWLQAQKQISKIPNHDDLLIETFTDGDRFYMVIYTFEGRLAHQTLGMLLTRRLERARARPLGFVATDYVLSIWGLRDFGQMIKSGEMKLTDLFDHDMLGDDLENWLDETFLLKRTFRQCATISGLVEKRHPRKEKTGRQMTVSSDLIYDVLRAHDPNHILLQATHKDAAYGFLDVRRISDMLERIKGKLVLKRLQQASPLAIPVMLEIGKQPVNGEANDALLAEAADEMLADVLMDEAKMNQ